MLVDFAALNLSLGLSTPPTTAPAGSVRVRVCLHLNPNSVVIDFDEIQDINTARQGGQNCRIMLIPKVIIDRLMTTQSCHFLTLFDIFFAMLRFLQKSANWSFWIITVIWQLDVTSKMLQVDVTTVEGYCVCECCMVRCT